MDVEFTGRATNGLQGKASFDYVNAHNDSAGNLRWITPPAIWRS